MHVTLEILTGLFWPLIYVYLFHDTEGLNEISVSNLMMMRIIVISVFKEPYEHQVMLELFAKYCNGLVVTFPAFSHQVTDNSGYLLLHLT